MIPVVAPTAKESYLELRAQGKSHEDAAERLLHMLGPGPAPRLEQWRDVYEGEVAAPPTPVDNGNGQPTQLTPLDRERAAAQAQISKLEAEEPGAAADALGDPKKRDRWVQIKQKLVLSYERLDMLESGAAEFARRGKAQAEREDRERKQRAQNRADQLGGAMATENAEIRRELTALAKRVARREALGHEQAGVLTQAGRQGRAQMPDVLKWIVEAFNADGRRRGLAGRK
jgi:hypothetical protein